MKNLSIDIQNNQDKRTIFCPNEIINYNNCSEIVLYRGRCNPKETGRAIIDKEDVDKVKQYKWGLDSGGYISTGGSNSKRRFRLHQVVLGKIDGLEIDHINNNKLDNRKRNLRHVTSPLCQDRCRLN